MSHINPEREQFKALYDLPLDHPVFMINLLRFREKANYAADAPEAGEPPVSGAEAYKRYGQDAAPYFSGVGGKQFWIGKPEATVIGPKDEPWDLAFIAYYPTGQAFIDMVKNPDYQKATRHRTAATVDSRLIRCKGLTPGVGFEPSE